MFYPQLMNIHYSVLLFQEKKILVLLLSTQIRLATTVDAAALRLEGGEKLVWKPGAGSQCPLEDMKVACKCEAMLIIFTVILRRTEIM